MDGLIFKTGGEMILFGKKTWEIRSKKTNKREEIYILTNRDSYTGKYYCLGKASIVDCVKLTKELYEENFLLHRINVAWEELPKNYQNGYIWVLSNPVQNIVNGKIVAYEYQYKTGCQTWIKNVKLEDVGFIYV